MVRVTWLRQYGDTCIICNNTENNIAAVLEVKLNFSHYVFYLRRSGQRPSQQERTTSQSAGANNVPVSRSGNVPVSRSGQRPSQQERTTSQSAGADNVPVSRSGQRPSQQERTTSQSAGAENVPVSRSGQRPSQQERTTYQRSWCRQGDKP